MILALLAAAWISVIIAACLAEVVLGDVTWPRRRVRPRRRASWADDPRSNGGEP